MNGQTAVLVIGDWSSWCGACGGKADPREQRHETTLAGVGGRCGAVWTHVAATVDANIWAADRIRQMRPDLVYLDELVDPNALPVREMPDPVDDHYTTAAAILAPDPGWCDCPDHTSPCPLIPPEET